MASIRNRNNLIKEVLANCGRFICGSEHIFKKILTRSGIQITIPFYHAVSDLDIPHLKHIINYKSISQFRGDLEFFSSYFTFIGIPELYAYLEGINSLPPNPMLITFDDGLKEFHKNAMQILEEYNAPAALFINSGFLDNKDMFYRHKASLLVEKISNINDKELLNRVTKCLGFESGSSFNNIIKEILSINYSQKKVLDKLAMILGVSFDKYLSHKQPYLTSSDVNEILDRGFYIGAHSIDHPDFNVLSTEQQLHQTLNSVNTVVDKFDLDYKIFSIPFNYSDLPKEYMDAIKEKRLEISFGGFGNIESKNSRNLQRQNMEWERYYPVCSILVTYYFVAIIKNLFSGLKNRIFKFHHS